jgi:RNA recognition motif-containing protein
MLFRQMLLPIWEKLLSCRRKFGFLSYVSRVRTRLRFSSFNQIQMENKLFVGNLSWGLTDESLKEAFEQAGAVLSATIMTDRATGRSRGFGFVEMETAEEAQAAIEMWHGKELDGRPLNVNVARPREER